jgi:hypothetical protein
VLKAMVQENRLGNDFEEWVRKDFPCQDEPLLNGSKRNRKNGKSS